MVAYNFSADMAPLVESGQKRQTIRRTRKRQTRVGDLLQLYTGMRTAGCVLLSHALCISVTPIEIREHNRHLVVILGGNRLPGSLLDRFVRADGFQRRMDMRDFFQARYGLPFVGEVIEWARVVRTVHEVGITTSFLDTSAGVGARCVRLAHRP